MLRRVLLAGLGLAVCAAASTSPGSVILPSGWRLSSPVRRPVTLSTMPQGLALSPDGRLLAIVESGSLVPDVRIYETAVGRLRATVPLRGAFGAPVWAGPASFLVAGANTDGVYHVNAADGTAQATIVGRGTWPAAVAIHGDLIATADDGAGGVTLLQPGREPRFVAAGAHPSAVVFSLDGTRLYAAIRQPSEVVAIDVASARVLAHIPSGLHPAALARSADGARVYVAESDDDSIGIIDTASNRRIGAISVQLRDGRAHGFGASPNALAIRGGDLFVSLGAQNAIARIRGDRVVERIPAGWYPTGVAIASDGTLFALNGKGERAPANPQYDPFNAKTWPHGYVANITGGSLRVISPQSYADAQGVTRAADGEARPLWTPLPSSKTIVRANGPIRHVIYVIKENRSYDQVLGDVPGANGDAKLAAFGVGLTPNQHAIVKRFGIFDNAYANSQTSPDGHNWTDAALANDYVERFWPVIGAGRRTLYDMQVGNAPDVPHGGYLWDAAKRAGITYRNYGEDLFVPLHGPIAIPINTMPGLAGHFDPRYVGWDPAYSDLKRIAEWRREFAQFVRTRTLPQLEIVYLPDDHTEATKPGYRTPQAYVATNDWAVGQLVETVSRSPYWKSTAILMLEDDAQSGPDHVSDQRSTFYVASPYARAGAHHAHYSTVGMLRTVEIFLGLPPLSIYDAVAQPMYDAFAMQPANAAPFAAVRPAADLNAVNGKAAYGAAISARFDTRRPDMGDQRLFGAITQRAVLQR